MSSQQNPPVKVRPEILAVPAYRQGAVPTKPGFKLSSNENPFPPLPGVAAAAAAAPLNRYAGQAMPELKALIGKKFGLDEQQSLGSVHLGSGSVTILYQLVEAVAGPGDEFIFAWPSFEGYLLLGLVSGATPVSVPLTQDFKHDLNAMAEKITDRTRAILLCSPNNPTGPVIGKQEFKEFMARVPSDVLVVLDEAYAEFVTDADAVRGEEEIKNYDNVVSLRTFSKAYGLASLRIGYGVGHPGIWTATKVTGIPLSVTGQAEAAAIAALSEESEEELATQIDTLIKRRTELITGLQQLGYKTAEAQGNFVWVQLGEHADAFGKLFTEEGTLVRPFGGYGVRISVGEAESIPEVLRIAEAFKEISGE